MKFSGEVKGARLLIDPAALAIALREFDGKRITLTIEPEKSLRTVRANSRYWSILVPLAGDYLQKTRNRELPYSKEQVHYVLKSAFLGVDETPLGMVPKDSHNLSVGEFYEFTEQVTAWLTQAGYPVPDSAEVA